MTQPMIFYRANCCGNEKNCSYPNRMEVTDAESFRQVVHFDYVCARYRDSYRSTANFDGANVICTDFDNDHSEDPADWITPEYVAQVFSGVPLAVHFSRNHMKPKNGKAARPKFHAAFLTDTVCEADDYKVLVKRLHDYFPYFDTNAMDAARFFFGTAVPQVEFRPGTMTLNTFLNETVTGPESDEEFRKFCENEDSIPQGSRNATMSRFAGRILKRFGDTEAAQDLYRRKAVRCDPPLEDEELNSIWQSARRFFSRVSQQDGYVPPEQYNSGSFLYKPDDCTDVGQARMLGKFFSGELRYTPSTDYLRYTGVHWQETKPGAQAVAHALTDLQLSEAEAALEERTLAYESTGAADVIASAAKKKAVSMLTPEQLYAYERYTEALNYRNYALQRRESRYITAALHEAHPVLEIDPKVLDRDWFLLCTPNATYDLRKGLGGIQEHNPENFCTHVTAVSPGDRGKGIWQDALKVFFRQDEELIRYVQRVAGICCVGQVFWEAMIIAYGDGRNGKSTFWNSLARVLGSYSGNISADSLTVGCKRNVKPEMAEARGKRLLIAAELEEGTRLNTSTVKQLCSTDNVFAEKKYKDPFSFTPSHTLVLYTNHLPRVGATDTGIWRRLVVIPFNAKIQGSGDIKNYTDYLFNNAGEAILAWMIEGARQAIELGFKIPLPRCVEQSIHAYREQNDWLGHFLSDRCDVEDGAEEKSGVLYKPGDPAYEKIKRSLHDFGYVDPVIWNEVTGNIVGGHQRYKVLVAEGATEIDCVIVHIENPQDEKALNIALNKATGDWEPKALADLLGDLQSSGYDIGATGFDAAEVDDLFSKVHDRNVKDDDCELKPDQITAYVQPGDVWTLGRHIMMCGDSTNEKDVSTLMGDLRANLIVTDPPYNVAYESADGKSIQNDSMADGKFYEFLLAAFRNMAAHMAEGGSAYIFHADTEGLNFRRAFKEAGFHISGVCIWVKNSLVLGRSPYQWQHEPVLFGWMPNGKHKWFADRKQTTVWNFDKPKHSAEHPTMKPIPLLAYPIKNSSAPNAVVMDLFGGSGSTLIACEETDRICRTMELDPRYATVIVERYHMAYPDGSISVLRDGQTLTYDEVASMEIEKSALSDA